MKHLKNLFLNEKFILVIILLNAIVIYMQVSGITHPVITIIDYLCTFVFLFEMIIKLKELGFKGYWSSGWNCLDGILVILSLPSLVELFIPTGLMDLSILLVLRVLRVLRFFRMLHFFPNFGQIIKGFNLAMCESYAIINSVFVDTMVADNNDDVKERLSTIEKKIDQLLNEKYDESNS